MRYILLITNAVLDGISNWGFIILLYPDSCLMSSALILIQRWSWRTCIANCWNGWMTARMKFALTLVRLLQPIVASYQQTMIASTSSIWWGVYLSI
jgi:hypothetical protein